MDLSVEAYAELMAELAAAGDRRAEVLARHGLDEDGWDAVDSAWQERLSEAMAEDGDGVSELLSAHAAAYAAAQRALSAPITLEQFAEVTRLLSASGDLRASLSKVGVSLADYVRAGEHWSGRFATDPDLERRFADVLRGR